LGGWVGGVCHGPEAGLDVEIHKAWSPSGKATIESNIPPVSKLWWELSH
jgi:hypothetical protein